MNNLRTSPLSSCKNLLPYFFMVHLLHRLYGVDAPGADDSVSVYCTAGLAARSVVHGYSSTDRLKTVCSCRVCITSRDGATPTYSIGLSLDYEIAKINSY